MLFNSQKKWNLIDDDTFLKIAMYVYIYLVRGTSNFPSLYEQFFFIFNVCEIYYQCKVEMNVKCPKDNKKKYKEI